MRQRNIRDKDFQNVLKDKILIGTYIGNYRHTKIMKSEGKSLVFQFLIHDQEILCPETSLKFFRKWSLLTAPWIRIGFFNDIYPLFDTLYNDIHTIEASE